MSTIILVSVTGEDRPGLTAALTEVLAKYNVDILDIGQAVIHDLLTLGMLIHIPTEQESSPVLEKYLFRAHELGLTVRFTPVSVADYESWVQLQGKNRYIITILARKLTATQISRIASVIRENGLNIDVITRLSGRVSLGAKQQDPRACVEFSVRGFPSALHEMRAQFLAISREAGVDIAFQSDDLYRRNRRLIVFDMDSTLIQCEVIDELARVAGKYEQVRAITNAAMRGEIDFKASLIERVSLLKGLEREALAKVADTLPLTEGTERLTAVLKTLGFKLAIISGGFNYFGKQLQEKLGFDYMFANELELRDERLTGEVKQPIIDGKRKAELLIELATKEQIKLEQTIAVGDGANDLPMLEVAGLGIAFHAKPLVRENARHSISTLGLDAVLYLIGIKDRETN